MVVLRFQMLMRKVTSNLVDSASLWVKNGGSKQFKPSKASYGGNVKNARNSRFFEVLALVGAGLLSVGLVVSGCKSAPDLTATQAQALIQAHYDALPAAPISIVVGDDGMAQGGVAKYWLITKKYQNPLWADFTLTPDGKKVVALANGSDKIEWRPATAKDPNYFQTVQSVATAHLKARDVKEPQDEVGGTKSVIFSEAVDVTVLPSALQDIAHNPGNKLSNTRTATFAVDNGAWKLQSVN